MIPISRLLTIVLGFFVVLLASLTADEPRPPHRVLVLANEATLVGQVEQEPTGYVVTNETGETRVPTRSVLRVCERMEDAYAFLKSRANLRDADERIRLARWCWSHDLLDQARAEADAATRLNPRSTEGQRLLKTLETAEPAKREVRPAAVEVTAAADRPATLRPVAEHTYAPETLQAFTRKVQPILFNGCGLGSCHGGVKKHGFELQRPFGYGSVPAHMTRQNLVQTLNLLDKQDPAHSPLLRKALEQHGGAARPPFVGKDSTAYQTLEAWVRETCGANSRQTTFAKADEPDKSEAPAEGNKDSSFAGGRPSLGASPGTVQGENKPLLLEEPATPPAVASSPSPSETGPAPASPIVPIRSIETPKGPLTEDPAAKPPATPRPRPVFQGGEPVGASQGATANSAPRSPAAEKPVKGSTKPVDPFDPLPFNRQHHPERP